jgi:hypothetical protein
MSRESSLWARIRNTAVPELRYKKHKVHLERIENSVGVGHTDVDGCIDGGTFFIELKSEDRPAKPLTRIHPKTRESQSIWHRERTEAGSRIHWVLLQVGEGRKARLYLIPGDRYDEIEATEAELDLLSVLPSTASPADVLLRATRGW